MNAVGRRSGRLVNRVSVLSPSSHKPWYRPRLRGRKTERKPTRLGRSADVRRARRDASSDRFPATVRWIGEKLLTPMIVGFTIFGATIYTTNQRTEADRAIAGEQAATARDIEDQRAKSSERLENLRYLRTLAQTPAPERFVLGMPSIDLHGMDLSGIDISGLNLNKANLSNITAADLTAVSEMPAGDQPGNTPSGSPTWARTQLNSVNLEGADLSFTSTFAGAQMQCARLGGARVASIGALKGDRVIPTDLRAADLRGLVLQPPLQVTFWPPPIGTARLDGADIRGVDFSRVSLDGVTWGSGLFYDDTTQWPESYLKPTNLGDPTRREQGCGRIAVSPFGKFEF